MDDRKILQWTGRIDTLTQSFRDRFSDLSAEELGRKPNAGTWSIAENIDHLIKVNESYFPMLDQLKEGKYRQPFLSRFAFLVKFMGNMILKSVEPSRRKKIRTFPMWEPVESAVPGDIVNEFVRHQARLKQYVESAAPSLARGVVIASPANQHIVYSLERAFDIIVEHEERHLNQAIGVFDTIYENQYRYDL